MKPAVLFTLFVVDITTIHAQSLQRKRNPEQFSGSDENNCPICLDIQDPVSDEEGNVYANECYMLQAKCGNKITLPPFWKDIKWVPVNYTSVRTMRPSPRRNCPEGCPDVGMPVCGSDGVTYGNPCELQIAACKHPELNIVEDSSEESCLGLNTNPGEEVGRW